MSIKIPSQSEIVRLLGILLIESIPIPKADGRQQQEILSAVRLIENEDDGTERVRLYNDLDLRIASLFSLSDAEYQVILNAVGSSILFLS